MHKQLILSAANQYFVTRPDGVVEHIIIPDSGHFGKNMSAIIKLLKTLGCELLPDKSDGDRGQGFITESGEYLSRSEAYKVAISSGQPFNPEYTLPNKKLDSSCIRHFDNQRRLEDYIPNEGWCCMNQEMIGECGCCEKGIVEYYSEVTGELL